MPHHLDLPLHTQIARLNSALSDPDGWSADVATHTLRHLSGLQLDMDTRGYDLDESYTELYLPYTEQASKWSQETPYGATFSAVGCLNTTTICKVNHSVCIDLFPAFARPDVDVLTRILHPFQAILRLNFTAAGQALLQKTLRVASLWILHRYPAAEGRWSICLPTGHARDPVWSSYREKSYPLDPTVFAPLLESGLPITESRYGDGFELTEYLYIDMPTTAHTRAQLLREAAILAAAP